jgi:hypothetical protein
MFGYSENVPELDPPPGLSMITWDILIKLLSTFQRRPEHRKYSKGSGQTRELIVHLFAVHPSPSSTPLSSCRSFCESGDLLPDTTT